MDLPSPHTLARQLGSPVGPGIWAHGPGPYTAVHHYRGCRQLVVGIGLHDAQRIVQGYRAHEAKCIGPEDQGVTKR
jgi:hypothetical protein